ncbi:MAG: DUF2341 domain-containing protein [Candidatus Bathyarchaeia archaeon]
MSVPIGSSGKFNVTASIFYDNENITVSLDPWWNSAWLMRRNITINNTVNSNTLADYQIPINLTYDSDIQPDFSDIRFTWYNSTDESETEIPYWIESKVDSQWAYVWVKVPYIPANGYATIYVYYKNSTPVTSASNGKNVFIWFNFDGNGTFDYEINESNSPIDVFVNDSNSVKHTTISSGRYEYGAFNGSYANVSIRAKINLGTLQSIENAGLMPQWTYTGTYNNNWVGCQIEYYTGYPNYTRWAIINGSGGIGGAVIVQTNSPAVSANTNYTIECIAFSNKTVIFKRDGSEILRGTSATTIMPAGYGLQAGWSLSSTQWFYDILVRKVADPEPSYLIGEEEKSLNCLTSCSVLDQEGMTYYLVQDIIDAMETCMNITANNVTLNCLGHTIDGIYEGYGIYVENAQNVRIENCKIAEWETGLVLVNTSFSTFSNMEIYRCNNGIWLNSGQNNAIFSMEIYRCNNGIWLNSGQNNAIFSNIIQNNTYGIKIGEASENIIYNNFFNNTNNFYFSYIYSNYWNTTKQEGFRIYSPGAEIGGNYWTNPEGSGYSDTCDDSDKDGFCDQPYVLNENNIDYMPLSDEFYSWWNYTWQHRKNITINNTANSNTLTDYQVAINLTYDSDMQSDFSDIRFTWYNSTSGTETEIPYWIESKVDSQWAYVWVKVPYIPANGYATIYVYYKNSTPVTSASNGKNVFIWFNFDGNGTFDYEINELNSPVDAFVNDSNSVKHIAKTSNRYEHGAFNGNYANVSIRGKINLGTLESIEDAGLMPQWTYTGTIYNNWVGCQIEYYTGYPNYTRWAIINASRGNLGEVARTNSPAVSANTNYTIECIAFSNKTIIFKLNGNEILRGVSPTTIMPAGYGLQAGYALSSTQWFYDILVRKVADPEPSYLIGEEEKSLNFLTSCSVLDQEGATYYLTQDIIDFPGIVCMDITANNVVLDCQGHTIDGVSEIDTYGIYIYRDSAQNTNITVKNCVVTDWWYGIYLGYAQNNTLINNTVNSHKAGFLVDFSSYNILINNTAHSYYGFVLHFSSYNTLINNTANSNSEGFSLLESSYNTLINNTANSNSVDGFWLFESSYNILINNTANSNFYGFFIDESYYNILINNTAHFNVHGLSLVYSSSNNITGGSIALSSFDYFLRDASTTNYFTDTNFTEARKIYFSDTTSWFNYRNESNGMWLKNKVSAGTTITRTLHSWKQTNITWTEQADTTVIAEYNLTGLLPNTAYYVQNSSGTYQIPTDSEGNLNFQTQLTTTVQTISVYYLPVYLTITFNYNSVNFGSLNHNTLNPAPNQESGIYNVSVEAGSSYKVEAYGNNFEGPASLSISNLYFDTAPSPSQLSFSNSVSLSTSPQVIDSNIPPSVTVHYHGYWLNIPYKQKKGNYYTTVYIIYSLE